MNKKHIKKPKNFDIVYSLVQRKEISTADAIKMLGTTQYTYYEFVKQEKARERAIIKKFGPIFPNVPIDKLLNIGKPTDIIF